MTFLYKIAFTLLCLENFLHFFLLAELNSERIEELERIAAANGKDLFDELLTLEEYRKLEANGQLVGGSTKAYFKQTVAKLEGRVDEFVAKHGAPTAGRMEESLLVGCKQFMLDLFREGAEGTILDLASFIGSKSNEKEKRVEGIEGQSSEHGPLHSGDKQMPADSFNASRQLGAIYECSKVQSELLDRAIERAMLEEHWRHRATAFVGQIDQSSSKGSVATQRRGGQSPTSPFEKVLIEGAGPNGLYAAFQFFLTGHRVMLVNDRLAYIRQRFIGLDLRWIIHLRWLLGSKFTELFGEQIAAGDEFLSTRYAVINLYKLETLLHARLRSLALLMATSRHTASHGPPDLEISFGVKFSRIEHDNTMGKYVGILERVEASKNISNLLPTASTRSVPFDLLLLAGGANDRIRNGMFETKQLPLCDDQFGVTDAYGVVVFGKRKLLLKGQRKVVFDAPINENQAQLRAQDIDGLLQRSTASGSFANLPVVRQFRQEYQQRTLLNRLLHHQQQSGGQTLLIVVSEMAELLQIACEMPAPMMELLERIDELKADGPLDQQQFAADLRKRVERKWFAALYGMLASIPDKAGRRGAELLHLDSAGLLPPLNLDEEGMPGPWHDDRLNFDPQPVNTSTFRLRMVAAKEPVKRLPRPTHPLVLAIGDANVSPYFLTTSGLNYSRISIESLARIVHDHNQKQHQKNGGDDDEQNDEEKKQFVAALTKELESAAQKAQTKARDYVLQRGRQLGNVPVGFGDDWKISKRDGGIC